MAKRDVFPQTENTWIGERLADGEGGRLEINRHVMKVYAWPLQVYFRGTSDRWLGEPEEIVQGFFADRLARDDFFSDWQQSGLRLRRWLMNAFCFFLKELLRKRRKKSREEPLQDEHAGETESVAEDIDRAFAVAIVQQALRRTRDVCEAKQLQEHWDVFYRHYYEGVGYKDIVKGLDIDTVRAATMSRTVAGKFRTILRELLVRDGATAPEVNRELEALLDISGE